MTQRRCPGCGESVDADATRLCERCELAVETAGEHDMGCECAACLVWMAARDACAELGLTLADVVSELA